jgi:Na+/melibiose symporter-like transporter
VLGIAGYIAAIAVLTPGYQLFQAANNTAVKADVGKERRGVVSGMLNLSRNLGLITGASVMGSVFAVASGTADITAAQPDAVAAGMRITFAIAAVVMIVALAVAVGGRVLDRAGALRPGGGDE